MLDNLNWIDLVSLIIIIFGAISGLSRGFIREFIGLFGWIISANLANRWYTDFIPKLLPYINSEIIAGILSFAIIFILSTIVINAVANAVIGPNSSKLSLFGRMDRLLGAVCGAVKGMAGLCILYLLAGIIFTGSEWPEPLQESRTIPYIYQGAIYINNLLPSVMQREVMVPQSTTPRLSFPGEQTIDHSPTESPYDQSGANFNPETHDQSLDHNGPNP